MNLVTSRHEREESRATRYERARTKLEHLRKVLAHWMEGLSVGESASRLELREPTVEHYRHHLELATGRGRHPRPARG